MIFCSVYSRFLFVIYSYHNLVVQLGCVQLLMRDKLNNLVLFDTGTYVKLLKDYGSALYGK